MHTVTHCYKVACRKTPFHGSNCFLWQIQLHPVVPPTPACSTFTQECDTIFMLFANIIAYRSQYLSDLDESNAVTPFSLQDVSIFLVCRNLPASSKLSNIITSGSRHEVSIYLVCRNLPATHHTLDQPNHPSVTLTDCFSYNLFCK